MDVDGLAIGRFPRDVAVLRASGQLQGVFMPVDDWVIVTLLRALRPDVGEWVTLSPRYWAGRPSNNDGGQAPYSAVRTVTQVGLPSLLAV